jgi:hypothetical protein
MSSEVRELGGNKPLLKTENRGKLIILKRVKKKNADRGYFVNHPEINQFLFSCQTSISSL